MALDIDPVHDFGNFNHIENDSLALATGKFVVVSATGDVSVNTVAGSKSFGVLRRGVSSGFVPPVRRAGGMAYVSKAAAYAPAIGDAVTNDVAGDAVLAVTGNVIQGVVVDVTSGADNEVRVLLSNGAETAPA
jgi:hypothetical protein